MLYLFGKEFISFLSRANVRAFHENPDSIYIKLTLLTLKARITKSRMLLSSAEMFEASSTNNVDQDQTAPVV